MPRPTWTRLLEAAKTAAASGTPSPPELRDGVGPGSALQGFRMRQLGGPPGSRRTHVAHVLHVGDTIVVLGFVGTWSFDEETQARAVAFAHVQLTSPDSTTAPPATPEVPRGTARMVRVVARANDGAPIPRADVIVTMDDGKLLPTRVTGTLTDGACTLRVPGGLGRVDVFRARTADGKPIPLAQLEAVSLGPEAAEATVTLEEGYELGGVVLGTDGQGAPGLLVRAVTTTFRSASSWHAEATTDATGAFHIVGLRDEDYKLEVLRDGTKTTASDRWYSPDDLDIEIQLVTTRPIRLVVRTHDGKPLPMARVIVRGGGPSGTQSVEEYAGRDGVVILQGLDLDEEYMLWVTPSFATDPAHELKRSAWRPADETLSLPQAWVLRGTVLAADGSPTDAWLHRRGSLTERLVGDRGFVRDDGTFVLGGLPMEAVDVVAYSEQYTPKDDDDVPYTRFEPTDKPVMLRVVEVPTRRPRDDPMERVTWDVPEGWVGVEPPLGHLFELRSKQHPAVVCRGGLVREQSFFETGALERWYRRMGLAPPDPARLDKLPRIQVLRRDCRLLELAGTYERADGTQLEGARLMAVARADLATALHVELVGPDEQVRAERDRFLQLCASLRVP
ncbi:MAG: carboxypeptidase-like regulatory domain-containing protein [Planctomycetota bacterium]